MKTGAIVQARTTSSRLPAKVLKELPFGSGISVLSQVIRRLKNCRRLDTIIIATTVNPEDDEVIEIAEKEGAPFFRGSEADVLSRFYGAAREHSLDNIVRITSDCPCLDPALVDDLIETHLGGESDYTSNSLERSFPHGLDAEVFSFDVLERAFNEAREDFEREHVTAHIYRSGNYRVQNIKAVEKLCRPDIRVTLDTAEDYALLCAVFDFLHGESPFFGVAEIVGLFESKPWLKYINRSVSQKTIHDTLEEELDEAVRVLRKQELNRAADLIEKGLGAAGRPGGKDEA